MFSFIHRRHKNKYVSVMIKVVHDDASSSWKEFGALVLIHSFVTTLGAKLHPLLSWGDWPNWHSYRALKVHKLRIALLTGSRGTEYNDSRSPSVEKS